MNSYDIGLFIGSLRRDAINRRLATALMQVAPAELRFGWGGTRKVVSCLRLLAARRP
ncbi:hypothetical protein [Cupriavidus sp. YAF13]|uniref:hypothetical protein n=1 Tax=Cupriavidus sp. YAF13 TaxID=3233075 RepID=UPI003F901454